MKVMKNPLGVLILVGLTAAASACGNTVKGMAKDTSNMGEKVSEGAKTVDVKSALIADKTIDTSTINVDTMGDTKTVYLRGSVPTAAMKQHAEEVAKREAPGYTIQNQLAVVPR